MKTIDATIAKQQRNHSPTVVINSVRNKDNNMNKDKSTKGDKALMIVSAAIILVGIIALFFNTILGIVITAVGIGMFVMGLVSKTPEKKIE